MRSNITMSEASIIVSAANTIDAINRLVHGIAAGKRDDLIITDLENAQDHFELLKTKIESIKPHESKTT